MKFYVTKMDEAVFKVLVTLGALKEHGVEVADNAEEADVILLDQWISPADPTKVYCYTFGPIVMQMHEKRAPIPEDVNSDHGSTIGGYPNAIYVGIYLWENLETVQKLVNEIGFSVSEPVLVIVDDDERNRENAKEAFPDALVLAKAEEAISLIQTGSRPIMAVITDLLMPLPANNTSQAQSADIPAGILVCFAAKMRGIPVAVLTRGHYKSSLEEYFRRSFATTAGIPVMDAIDKSSEEWRKAFELALAVSENVGSEVGLKKPNSDTNLQQEEITKPAPSEETPEKQELRKKVEQLSIDVNKGLGL